MKLRETKKKVVQGVIFLLQYKGRRLARVAPRGDAMIYEHILY